MISGREAGRREEATAVLAQSCAWNSNGTQPFSHPIGARATHSQSYHYFKDFYSKHKSKSTNVNLDMVSSPPLLLGEVAIYSHTAARANALKQNSGPVLPVRKTH